MADTVPCDVILGTDPDADRVAIAVPCNGGYQKLSGNELGCLLMDYVLKARATRKDIPAGAITVRSIVSTPLADRIAAKYGVTMKAVLTGGSILVAIGALMIPILSGLSQYYQVKLQPQPEKAKNTLKPLTW